MGDEGRRLLRPGIAKARVEWALVVFLFLLAYIFFALAFVLVRLWLWASVFFFQLALKWRATLLGGPYERLLPGPLREEEAEERLADLIAKNREVLERYGWLP